ncbi:hypothetical protein CDC22_16185 [Pseudomonas aeruginosa]|uniref:Uncharacterized protein n=1 Tax=Pseudomonas aeruginosa TaxID=287 RepID=A0A0B7KT87_PSEAI|nr:hypothetical protein X778_19385 [Pseudomonas aeruginosa VRFPA07]OWI81979.1 hypothetical protein CDC22_16185 [Pseudomonas aeruginosa]PTZ32313.1 hypothetical protein DB395_30260 [Pseudomonas aeruginosa]RAP64057.1 hypothetical protein AXW85_29150 [Pseudomonas aeruginosa]CEO58225.1 hypothetical protein PAMH19_p0015 [Pseudomonas aeruginosa]
MVPKLLTDLPVSNLPQQLNHFFRVYTTFELVDTQGKPLLLQEVSRNTTFNRKIAIRALAELQDHSFGDLIQFVAI